MIDANNAKIEAIRRQQNRTQLAIEQATNPNKFGSPTAEQKENGSGKMTRKLVKREIVNDDGDVEVIEEYVNVPDNGSGGGGGGNGADLYGGDEFKAADPGGSANDAIMEVLDAAANELASEFSDDFKQMVASQNLQSDKHGVKALETITQVFCTLFFFAK